MLNNGDNSLAYTNSNNSSLFHLPIASTMSRSSEGDECGNSDIDEIDKKLQNISMDGREEGDADVDGNDDVDDGNDDNEHNSISEHEQSTMSQANYYDETSLNLNNLNHLFHIDFMRSVQNLRTHERRLVF